MTVADNLSTGVDNLFECSVAVRITFILIPVAMVFQFCGISTGAWSDSNESSLGLWGYCYTSGDLSCCQNIADKIGNIPAWITATHIFQGLACVMACISMVALILYTCVTKTTKSFKISMFAVVSSCLTAFLLMISASIYGVNYRNSSWLPNHHLAGSFVVVLIAFFLYAIAGVILLVVACHDRQSCATVTPGPDDVVPNIVQPTAPPAPVLPARPSRNEANNDCIICMDRPKGMIFLDCGHIACCEECSGVIMNGTRECPTCRQYIRECRRYYNA